MSPEQVTGHARLDGRSDIYSLGCVLYEMLAESRLSSVPPSAVTAGHLVDPPPRLSKARPSLPIALESVVNIALAKLAADRFPTAQEFCRRAVGARARRPRRATKLAPGARAGTRSRARSDAGPPCAEISSGTWPGSRAAGSGAIHPSGRSRSASCSPVISARPCCITRCASGRMCAWSIRCGWPTATPEAVGCPP